MAEPPNDNEQGDSAEVITQAIVPDSALYNLPNELILEIGSHLPIHCRLALTRTCHHFRDLFANGPGKFTVKNILHLDLYGPGDTGLSSPSEYTYERDMFLSLIEHDEIHYPCSINRHTRGKTGICSLFAKLRKPKEEKQMWCSYCGNYHSPSLFTETMRTGWRHERICVGGEGTMWICPHKQFSHRCFRNFRCLEAPCHDATHEVWIDMCGVTVYRPVMPAPNIEPAAEKDDGGPQVTLASLWSALCQRNVHICPHLLMSDSQVLQAAAMNTRLFKSPLYQRCISYCRYLVQWIKNMMLDNGDSDTQYFRYMKNTYAFLGEIDSRGRIPIENHHWCYACKTSFVFVTKAMPGGKAICLRVFRPFLHEFGAAHPAWYRGVTLPEQFEEMEQEWNDDAATSGFGLGSSGHGHGAEAIERTGSLTVEGYRF
ncbi:MAG: hypothetical protein Q9201_000844 [Fulgogasparrea decipioides]